MRLVSYDAAARPGDEPVWRAGVLVGDQVVDAALAGAGLATPGTLTSVRAILALGPELAAELGRAAAGADATVGTLDAVRLGPPVPDPDKLFCIGLNYVAHAEEVELETRATPTVFMKFRNSLIGSGAPIRVPPTATAQVDYEGELAVVIGRRGARLSVDEALGVVAGAMPLNDVSARDLQFSTTQWTAGKAVDTFAPCGPALVLVDEIEDLGNLRISTRVNGETLQDASTSQMIFSVAELVAHVSTFTTLEPGDIIATGTPEGVGFTREPPVFLGDGDVVEVEIEGLGVVRNPVEFEG